MVSSFIIRTYNEAQYLGEVLAAIVNQETFDAERDEIVLVDSGSTDDTVSIATRYGCKILHIPKADFTFGRSLNLGCEAAIGDVLIILSGHCIPTDDQWMTQLQRPLGDPACAYVYGRQIGRSGVSPFSEDRVFHKNYPPDPSEQLGGFFCNNANAALRKSAWLQVPFDEALTGLEDMAAAKQLMQRGYSIAYASKAIVEHIHHEGWQNVRLRYEREAIALQNIMPEVQVSFLDFCRYTTSSIWLDLTIAKKQQTLTRHFRDIVCYRFNQFWGTYKGHHDHRKLSRSQKELYFYPK